MNMYSVVIGESAHMVEADKVTILDNGTLVFYVQEGADMNIISTYAHGEWRWVNEVKD